MLSAMESCLMILVWKEFLGLEEFVGIVFIKFAEWIIFFNYVVDYGSKFSSKIVRPFLSKIGLSVLLKY